MELGGYFGYSAIRFAFLARKYQPDAHYFSVEYNPVLGCVIEKLARFAGLSDAITVLIGNLTQRLPNLKDKIKEMQNLDKHVGFVLLDHDKQAYSSDLQLAYKAGLFKPVSNFSIIIQIFSIFKIKRISHYDYFRN